MGHLRCRWAIVWLLLALLPLRGWAFATMHPPAAEAAPPCHAAAHDDAPGDSGTAGCALCDVCHGAMLGWAPPPAALPAPAAQPPADARPEAPPSVAAEAPFRPPRR